MTIRVEQDERRARKHMREGFVRAWKSMRCQHEEFSSASPEALFRAITPARWTVLARLQRTGPSGLRALACSSEPKRTFAQARGRAQFRWP